ncbi:transcription elongation regulator 1-like protein [Gastrophryne carolinensis]
MLPISRIKQQPIFWPVNTEPAPWICLIPETPSIFRIGTIAPPWIVPCPQLSPYLQGVPTWQIPCDPFLSLMSVPTAPQPAAQQFPIANGQWVRVRPPAFGFSPSSSAEMIPEMMFPHVYTSTVPPHSGKCWVENRRPNFKILHFNSNFALDSSWKLPAEELLLFQGLEKRSIGASQVTMAVSRAASAPGPLHSVIIRPPRIAGRCLGRIKSISSNPPITFVDGITAPPATLLSMDAEFSSVISPLRVPSYHELIFSPIKIPLRASRLPAHSTRAIGTSWAFQHQASVEQVCKDATWSSVHTFTKFYRVDVSDSTDAALDKKETRTATCSAALILHSQQKIRTAKADEKDTVLKVPGDEDCTTKGNKPVASTPVPGSPWCVVWTGDDKVFFFNPTIQLSVWDKPNDLKNREDINRIIEDPPHKRKLESSSIIRNDGIRTRNPKDDDHSTKIKRNKTEESQTSEPVSNDERTEQPPSLKPLDERINCFRNMLLERGVSAFSTWEKELHKTVFDPRYLLLNSEERKQVFEQFVKARIKVEYKEKRRKLMFAKEEFKKLLEESKLSPRTTFKEFVDKYGRDQRFRVVQKRKDQELFFSQFINSLKKRDKENRMRLRKMR